MTLIRPRAAHVSAPSYHNLAHVSIDVPISFSTTIHEHHAHTHRRDVVYRERMLLASPPAALRLSVVELKRIEEQRRYSPAVELNAPAPRWESRLLHRTIAQDVLVRTRRVEEMLRHLRSMTAAASKIMETARRVIRQSARREERPASASMMLRPQVLSPVNAAREPLPEASASTTVQDQPRAGAPPSFNLDALTSQVMDQIDRRVVAWRERMGKY
jgi:hypothetical protein